MKALSHLNKYFAKYKYRFSLGIFFVVASNLFSVFPAKSLQKAIDALSDTLKHIQDTSAQEGTYAAVGKIVLFYTGLILLFALIRGIFMYCMRQTLIVMSRKIEYDMKNEVFDHYQQLDMAFYRRNNTGDLMARISEDVSRVRMYIGPAIMYFTNLLATFAVVIPAMFSVNGRLAIYVLLPLPVLSYSIFYVNNLINRRSDAIQSQLSKITSFVQEAFNGIRVMKAFGVEKYSQEAFQVEVNEYRDRSLSLARVDAAFFPLMVFLTGLSNVIVIFVGGMMTIRGEITIGNIAEYVYYVNLLVWPVTALGFTTSLIQRAAASQQRINEFLQTKPEIVSTDDTPFHFQQEIVFDQVTYQYPGKTLPALKGISFTLKKGKTLAILGSTGSGKTTLVNLLLRMMDIEQGRITVDGKELKTIPLKSYRASIGYAPQDVFLFSDTIANNIAFGEASGVGLPEKIEAAAADAALTATIHDFPLGFETVIGERGVTLSGGQKQRVSIARALVKNPDILILDDCLSAVDTKTESLILTNLRRIMVHKTAVLISHRVSTVKDADHILILHEGEIAEAGTHSELMQLRGLYHSLYLKQMAEEVDLA